VSTLEEQFHLAMIDIYERIKEECNYMAAHFIQMIHEVGGLGAAKRLLKSDIAEVFETLSSLERLDISMEALILKPIWSELFNDEERTIAKERLLNHGFDVSQLLEPDNKNI